jgi:hypothetical protein
MRGLLSRYTALIPSVQMPNPWGYNQFYIGETGGMVRKSRLLAKLDDKLGDLARQPSLNYQTHTIELFSRHDASKSAWFE